MKSFATVDDVITLWRNLKPDEMKRAEALLEVVSASLCVEAEKVGKNLKEMVLNDACYAIVVKSVTVDVVARTLMTATDGEPMVQESQSALGYSWSGSFLNPGGGLFIKDAELKRLGLKKQRARMVDFYE